MVAVEYILVDSGQIVGDPWSLVVVVVNWFCSGDLLPNLAPSLDTAVVLVEVVQW